jgi:hypothetical protein
LKKLTSSERPRFDKKKLLAQRPSPRRELSSTPCNSNSTLRKHHLSKLAPTPTRRALLIKLDSKVSARE